MSKNFELLSTILSIAIKAFSSGKRNSMEEDDDEEELIIISDVLLAVLRNWIFRLYQTLTCYLLTGFFEFFPNVFSRNSNSLLFFY